MSLGVQNLQVEVDAQYIKGMLNEPDLQPNTTLNRWIQGVLMFDFKLIHVVPADKHRGPDALSRRERAEGESVEDDDDSLLDFLVTAGAILERGRLCDRQASTNVETTDPKARLWHSTSG